MAFEDNFSKQSALYRRYRPHYSADLFAYLASLVPFHQLAWDVGTGNGQAALGLSKYFDRVVATDPSAAQIENALYHERIEYRATPANSVDLDSHSVDLITAAQSLHWFDLDAFYAEVRRVSKPGGVLAVWTYELTRITPEIDQVIKRYSTETVGPFWSDRLKFVLEHYATIPFPFEEMTAPAFELKRVWNLTEMEGYLSTWSATQAFIRERGYDPVREIHPQLAQAWGAPERERLVRWPLYFRIGRVGNTPEQNSAERQLVHAR